MKKNDKISRSFVVHTKGSTWIEDLRIDAEERFVIRLWLCARVKNTNERLLLFSAVSCIRSSVKKVFTPTEWGYMWWWWALILISKKVYSLLCDDKLQSWGTNFPSGYSKWLIIDLLYLDSGLPDISSSTCSILSICVKYFDSDGTSLINLKIYIALIPK